MAIKAKQEIKGNVEAPGVLGTFTGKCCDSNVINNNDMHLGREVFEKLIASEEFKRAMKNRHYIGFAGHPADADCQEFEHACIVMTDMRIAENGEIEGDFDLVDTPVGRTIKAFIDAGVNFGISIRGVGEVDSNGEVDPDEFIFRGFDLVTFPAYDDCIPEFKAIAASTDPVKKSKYKKICASIDANLKDINSCEALELIQDQLPEGCDEFNKVQDRIDEINSENKIEDDAEIAAEVEAQRLDAMMQLYLDATDRIHQLEAALADCNREKCELTVQCSSLKTKQSRMDRITANQIATANADVEESEKRVKEVEASLKVARRELKNTKDKLNEQITANTRLKDRIESLNSKRRGDLDSIKASNDLNLKYKRKVEATNEAISQKDSEIEGLKSKLNETVDDLHKLETKASNLDDENKELLSRVEAAEEMVSSYQQAYANMYANALGVYLTGLPVTAETTVSELKQMISAGTSTANIPAAPSFNLGDEVDYIEEEDTSEDDDTRYGADLVSL